MHYQPARARAGFIFLLQIPPVPYRNGLQAIGKSFLDELFFAKGIEEEFGDSTLSSGFLLLAIIACLPVFLAFSAVHVAYYALFFLGAATICICFLLFEALIVANHKRRA